MLSGYQTDYRSESYKKAAEADRKAPSGVDGAGKLEGQRLAGTSESKSANVDMSTDSPITAW